MSDGQIQARGTRAETIGMGSEKSSYVPRLPGAVNRCGNPNARP